MCNSDRPRWLAELEKDDAKRQLKVSTTSEGTQSVNARDIIREFLDYDDAKRREAMVIQPEVSEQNLRGYWQSMANGWQERAELAEAKCARYEKALREYVNPDNWFSFYSDNGELVTRFASPQIAADALKEAED